MTTAGAPSSLPAQGSSGNSNGTLLPPPQSPAAAGTTAQTPQMVPTSSAITREPIAIDECGATNPAGLSPAGVQTLKAGAGSPGSLRLLYPYDGTVFPRGMLAPDLMWDGAEADAVYVHIKSKIFEYWGCLTPTAPGRVTLPQDAWENAGQRSFGREDDHVIELSTFRQGAATGPAITHVQIARSKPQLQKV